MHTIVSGVERSNDGPCLRNVEWLDGAIYTNVVGLCFSATILE
jgi:hypothetical protein